MLGAAGLRPEDLRFFRKECDFHWRERHTILSSFLNIFLYAHGTQDRYEVFGWEPQLFFVPHQTFPVYCYQYTLHHTFLLSSGRFFAALLDVFRVNTKVERTSQLFQLLLAQNYFKNYVFLNGICNTQLSINSVVLHYYSLSERRCTMNFRTVNDIVRYSNIIDTL